MTYFDEYDSDRNYDSSDEIFMASDMESIAQQIRIYIKDDGLPLDADLDNELWREIRRNSVSATDARKLVKLNGEVSAQRSKLLDEKLSGNFLPFLEAFELGIQREPEIAKLVQDIFPQEHLIHNRYLAIGENPRHVATPDMVGPSSLCEIKVSTKPLKLAKTTYRDQLQWQMHVTGYEKVLFVVENRHSEELEYEWVFRDQARISTLIKFADEFIAELDNILETESSLGKNFFDEDIESEDSTDEATFEVGIQGESSVIDYADQFEDLPIVNLLSNSETRQALTLYGHGLSIYQIASEISRPSNDIVGTFGIHFYGLDEVLVNPMAGKFRYGWTFEEMTRLSQMFQAGNSVDEICSVLERDRLGVLYKIFMSYCPEIPEALVKSFKL